MTIKEVACKSENLENEAEKIRGIQNAICEAIYKGDNGIESYEWAWVALGEITLSLIKELKELKDKSFEETRKNKETISKKGD